MKAGAVQLRPADAAAVCVFSTALDHFGANLPLLLAERSPESVHQMRAALRRLRAAGFVCGWFAHAAQEGAVHARRSERQSRKLEPFWA